MKKGMVVIVLLFLLPFGQVKAIDLSDRVEPITISEIVEFHPYDRQLIESNSFTDNGYNGSSTFARTIWIGGFPLVEGIADDVDFMKRPNLMYGNVSIRLISFDGNESVRVSMHAVQKTASLAPERGISWETTVWRTVFSEMMQPNQTMESSFEFTTANDRVQLPNGSEIWLESYNYLLEYTNSTINYGLFQVSMTSSSNWTYSAKVEVEIQTIHNPVFFKAMEDRYLQFNPTSSLTTSVNPTQSSDQSVTTPTESSSVSSKDESSMGILGLLWIPVLPILRRKFKKSS